MTGTLGWRRRYRRFQSGKQVVSGKAYEVEVWRKKTRSAARFAGDSHYEGQGRGGRNVEAKRPNRHRQAGLGIGGEEGFELREEERTVK